VTSLGEGSGLRRVKSKRPRLWLLRLSSLLITDLSFSTGSAVSFCRFPARSNTSISYLCYRVNCFYFVVEMKNKKQLTSARRRLHPNVINLRTHIALLQFVSV
jgi:hypothetical protein